MAETADRIVEIAEDLIQERGFSGFSFQDVAERIGIKKGSLYYHFAAKSDLGRAVIQRYRKQMRGAAGTTVGDNPADYWRALNIYLQPMLSFGRTPGQACICGVLGGEYLGLPEDMQAEIKAFFDEHEVWLGALLERGRASGAFAFAGDPQQLARLIFSAMEGALLIKRIQGDQRYFDGIVDGIAQLLGGAPADSASAS